MRPSDSCGAPRHARVATLFDAARPLRLDSGRVLAHVEVAYETWGQLDRSSSNAILVCHALTANSHAGGEGGWWQPHIGPGRAIDTNRYFVLCPNLIGSCYGSTGPCSIDPATGKPYGPAFPEITVRDMVRVQRALVQSLGIRRLATVIGSSLGGMQVLEWALMVPELCESIVPVSTAAQQSAWCLALGAISRYAITSDPGWQGGRYERQPERGLAVARMVGMVSYRSPQELSQRFGRARTGGDPFDPDSLFEVERYLRHQGRKLADRFDANAYLALSRAMDRHDVGEGRGGVAAALSRVGTRALCIGVTSDIRYPLDEQRSLAGQLEAGELGVIESDHGHDAFLIEFEQLADLIGPFLESVAASREAA